MGKTLGGKILRKGIEFLRGDVRETFKGKSLVDTDMILDVRREAGTADNIYDAPNVQAALETESGYDYPGPAFGQIREEV